MRKKKGFLKTLSGNMKRKATNSAKQGIYMAIWHTVPPKEKRIV